MISFSPQKLYCLACIYHNNWSRNEAESDCKYEDLSSKFAVVIVQLLSHVWLWDPMDCNMPVSSVLHYLSEFVRIEIHWVGGAF